MARRKSKTKHIDKYPYLLHWSDPSDVPLDTLAWQWGVHKNLVIALIGSAKRNMSIYNELRRRGYTDAQIPKWFAKPKQDIAQNVKNAGTHAEHAKTVRYTAPPVSNLRSARGHRLKDTGQASASPFQRSPSLSDASPLATLTPAPRQVTVNGYRSFVDMDGRVGRFVDSSDVLTLGDNERDTGPRSPLCDLIDSMREEMALRSLYDLQDSAEERRHQRELTRMRWRAQAYRGSPQGYPPRGHIGPLDVLNVGLKNPEWRAVWNSMTPDEKSAFLVTLRQAAMIQNPWMSPEFQWMMFWMMMR